MSDHPTSPQLPVDPGIVTTQKQFSDNLTMDLNDDEIKRALAMLIPIREKWQERFRAKAFSPAFGVEQAMQLVDEFEDELKTELMDKMGLITAVDVTPLFDGEPMVIEFTGVIDTHPAQQYGFDHEKKGWEVKKATERGEDYLGQKGQISKRKQ